MRSLATTVALMGLLQTSSMASRAVLEKPYLSPELQEKLQDLPYGLLDHKSLFLRYRHVDAVQFFGGGTNSHFSFKRGQSLLNEGLSLRLVQNRKSSWASGAIQLRKPLDLAGYNSLVVWVWPSRPDMRLWVGLKGGVHARTDALPSQGLLPHEPAQLVIPFSRFSPKSRLNWNAVQQIYLEFGQETVGNPPRGVLQILGIAFVRQDPPLRQAMMVLGRANSSVVLAEPLANLDQEAPEDLAPTASPVSPAAAPTPAILSLVRQRFRDFLKMSEQDAAGLFEKPAPPAPPKPVEVSPQSADVSDSLVQNYAHGWPAPPPEGLRTRHPMLAAPPYPYHSLTIFGFYALFFFALTAFWFFVLRRRSGPRASENFSKVLTEIHWPFSITQPVLHRKVEREFWIGVADQQETFGWLSTTGLVIEKATPSEYFGEPFLRRQIALARRAGVRLFPSLSFTNSLFRKEGFQVNLDRSSTALRTLAIETLLRFADIAEGARIENVVELLSTKLRRKARPGTGDGKANEGNDALEQDFWTDVVRAVKSKKPGFVFIADAVGDQSRLVREAGFDYYENNLFVSTLLDQIRLGKVGDALAFLKGESSTHLRRSIFNISPLLRPLPRKDSERHQNVLCAILLTLLPGIVQHDNNIPEDLAGFIRRMGRSSLPRYGHFTLLSTSNPSILAFARWRKKALMVAVANFSSEEKNDIVSLRPLLDGFENNKLYLFNNALHGTSTLKNLLNQPPSDGPALAMWGQNLRDSGLPLSMPGLSLSLFSINISRSIGTVPDDKASAEMSMSSPT